MDSKESLSQNDRHDEEWPVSLARHISNFLRSVDESRRRRRKEDGREAGKAEDDESDAREFLALVPRPISTRVYSSGCALHGAQCNGRRYGRVAS
ncbi:Uncharacterized protein DBV15_01658 [Temnothorax longispinosus]|uniref:Uncharacterized protein n=1 Tax=Temnothorax longispinosus TaxID=300112 RepID=A0A4S2L6K1_9HYME|nr:Uncharacterized protein DBV15_01658 [Temnothorax longispinosus]